MAVKTQPQHPQTPEKVAALLRKHSGNMAAVGRSLGISRTAVWTYINARPALKMLVEEYGEVLVDDSEEGLHEAVQKREAWAIQFALKTKGRKRGYVERRELTGGDGKPLNLAGLSDTEFDLFHRVLARTVGLNGAGSIPASGNGTHPPTNGEVPH